jgi:hypothetical protein
MSHYNDMSGDMGWEMDQISQLFKIIIIGIWRLLNPLGDAGCGKTNILNRCSKNEFDPSSKPTLGVEFGTKTIEIDKETQTNVK